jgi:hypothetical protein
MGLTVIPSQCSDDTVTFAVTALVCRDRPAGQPGVPAPGTGAFVADGDSSTFARHAVSAVTSAVSIVRWQPAGVQNGCSARLGPGRSHNSDPGPGGPGIHPPLVRMSGFSSRIGSAGLVRADQASTISISSPLAGFYDLQGAKPD